MIKGQVEQLWNIKLKLQMSKLGYSFFINLAFLCFDLDDAPFGLAAHSSIHNYIGISNGTWYDDK